MSATPAVTFGELLRWLIERTGLTQADVADRAMVSTWHLSRIVNGKAAAGPSVLRELGRVLGVDPMVLAVLQVTDRAVDR
jgi:transcriptional regulator with XRE-family HTH domain